MHRTDHSHVNAWSACEITVAPGINHVHMFSPAPGSNTCIVAVPLISLSYGDTRVRFLLLDPLLRVPCPQTIVLARS